MKTKKHLIILSGLLTLISIICYAVLQFYCNDNVDQHYKNIIDFLIVVSSGFFTGSCVTLIISIREYKDEKEMALRNLLRLANHVKEKYKQILFVKSVIPEDIAKPYLLSRRIPDMFDMDEKEKELYNLDPDGENEAQFRECIWENELPGIKRIYEDKKEEYLNKKCPKVEKEYLRMVDEFIKSIRVFSDFDVYLVQEALDKLCFFFHNKERKDELEAWFLPSMVTDVKFIKYYIHLTSTSKDLYMNSLFALNAINTNLLSFSKNRDKAYLIPVYEIDNGKILVKKLLNKRKKDEKLPDLAKYDVDYKDMDFGDEIIIDALEK